MPLIGDMIAGNEGLVNALSNGKGKKRDDLDVASLLGGVLSSAGGGGMFGGMASNMATALAPQQPEQVSTATGTSTGQVPDMMMDFARTLASGGGMFGEVGTGMLAALMQNQAGTSSKAGSKKSSAGNSAQATVSRAMGMFG